MKQFLHKKYCTLLSSIHFLVNMLGIMMFFSNQTSVDGKDQTPTTVETPEATPKKHQLFSTSTSYTPEN